jgi:hypothetical protein
MAAGILQSGFDQAAPFGGMAALDPNDADFGDPVAACGHAGRFQVNEGNRVWKHRFQPIKSINPA